MSKRDALLARKEDLYSALRLLEEDFREGGVDRAAYQAARERYEREAADVLRRLDGLSPEAGRRRKAPLSWMTVGAATMIVVAMALILLFATHARSAGGTATGDEGGPTPVPLGTPSPVLVAAESAALAHPRDYETLLRLGDAFLQTGDALSADRAYLRASAVQPQRPEAPTLHAMLLGAQGHDSQALSLLTSVERSHSRYARAYLLEGVIAAHHRGGYARAIRAWRHFLQLNPTGTIAARVRTWIRSAQKIATAKHK